ncbi:hypothetical protein [Alkalihalobacillus sp. MEB130]|nr:hypothetical protein [Alkalihalobacillus sp. MEB130]
MVHSRREEQDLPKEWVPLVKEAIQSKVSTDDFKKFLQNYAKNNSNK